MDSKPRLPWRHLYILLSKKTIIQFILWRTGKTGQRMILMYSTVIFPMCLCSTTAEYNWNVSTCYCVEMYSPPFNNIFFLCVSVGVCLVPGCSGVWHCAEGWFYYQTVWWHSHPQHALLACLGYVSWPWQWLEEWGDMSSSIQNNGSHKKNGLNLLSMVLKAYRPHVF